MRENKRKPIILIALAFLHFIIPVVLLARIVKFHNIELNAAFTFVDIVYTPFQEFAFHVLLFSAPVLAFGLFMVYLWSFYVFYVFSVLIIFFVGAHLLLYNLNDLTPITFDLAIIVIQIAMMYIYARKSIRLFFFNPMVRWWKRDNRYVLAGYNDVDMKVDLIPKSGDDIVATGKLYDLSVHGSYISTSYDAEKGDCFDLSFSITANIKIECECEILRVVKNSDRLPNGFAVIFKKLNKQNEKHIRNFLKSLE